MYENSVCGPHDFKRTLLPSEFRQQILNAPDLFWWEPGKFWVVTSYELAKTVMTSEDYSCDRTAFFISVMPEMNLSLIGDYFKVVSKMMVMRDDMEHSRRRRICLHGLTSQCIDQLQPLIEKTIGRYLGNFTGKVPYDFVTELAQTIPFTVLAELFAIPEKERFDLYNWSIAMTQFFGGNTSYQNTDGVKVNLVVNKLRGYFADLIEQRHKKPGQDFISRLLPHQVRLNLDDEDLISQIIMMLIADQSTTTNQMSNNLYILLATPGLWSNVRENIVYLDDYLDECSRLDPAVPFIFRLAKKNTILGREKISKGAFVFIATNAINRDSTYFPNSDEINIQTQKNHHFSYGYGSHFCIGAKLARVEMYTLFKMLLQRFPTLKMSIQIPPLKKPESLSFSGFENFNLEV